LLSNKMQGQWPRCENDLKPMTFFSAPEKLGCNGKLSVVPRSMPAMNEKELLQIGFRYALSLRPVREDAEDLVQEACCRLYRQAGGVRDKAQLFTTIRHLFIDQYRRERRVMYESLEEAPEIASLDLPMDDRVRPEELAGPLAQLRAEEREVLYLHVVEGYTAQEIASLTNRSRGTILSLVYRTKRKLHKALTQDSTKAQCGGKERS